MGGAPVIETIRDGVQFAPAAAAAFRRAETEWYRRRGRLIDCNSTYRDYDLQMRMYLAWNAYVASGYRAELKPDHSRAIHPDLSRHTTGLALDSDDWTDDEFIELMADNGFIRTAADDPTERHHFEYQWWRDNHRNEPASSGSSQFNPITFLEGAMTNPIINVVDINGRDAKFGTIFIGRDDGTFEELGAPFANNIRGILSVAFLGGKGDGDLSDVTLTAEDFNAVKPIWATMCKGRTAAQEVWDYPIQAQDGRGNGLTDPAGQPVRYSAAGYIASTNSQVGGTPADVDEQALAASLAPLLTSQLTKIPDADISRIAQAAADEKDRRDRERLAQ